MAVDNSRALRDLMDAQDAMKRAIAELGGEPSLYIRLTNGEAGLVLSSLFLLSGDHSFVINLICTRLGISYYDAEKQYGWPKK